MDGACNMHRIDEKEVHTQCYLEKLKGRDHLKDLDIDGRIRLK
jgi:hypothetical protein